MTELNTRQLKQQAQCRLSQAGDTKKLVLIHSGTLVLLSLLITSLNLYLDSQISGTGGLSGMGTRTILQTLQQLLQYGVALCTPFWQAGFLLIAIRWATGAPASEKDLLSGFKRFGSLLSYTLWISLLYFSILFVIVYASTAIVLMTPFGTSLLKLTEVMMYGTQETIAAIPPAAILTAYAPVLLASLVLGLPIYLFLHYTLRLSTYFIMTDKGFRGFSAIRASAIVMRGNRRQLLKLDLSYWWYYVLEFLLGLVAYLDVILSALGIPLPVDGTTAFLVTLVLYGVLSLALHLWMKAPMETTYALAYKALSAPFLAPAPHTAEGEDDRSIQNL